MPAADDMTKRKATAAAGRIPRPEHPRMQFRREDSWINLNGMWNFAFDPGKSGAERGWAKGDPADFGLKINVPFCPESRLSGIGDVDFHESVWYRREVAFPSAWAGRRIALHFGGVDFLCEVWIDGRLAGTHVGGSSPFSLDVTALARPGEKQTIVVHALDELRSGMQGRGKQCTGYYSRGCSYTRVTGIWQTVWAEAADPRGLASCRIVPNFDASEVVLEPRFFSVAPGSRFRATVRTGGKTVAEREVPAAQGLPVVVPVPDARPWSPSDPFLYDLELSVAAAGGETVDSVQSYFAMRKVSCEGGRVLLNGKPVFLRFVLDQGFYPDGVWTAPSDAELRRDIERSMAAGFNGARLHQKVFEDRYHYWADRLGYLTWAEYASWSFDAAAPEAQRNFHEDWNAAVVALRDHPSIVGWTPFNETTANHLGMWKDGAPWVDPADRRFQSYQRFVRAVVADTRALDPTRPVNDASGWIHVETDLWTVHSYRATPKEQRAWLLPEKGGRPVAANVPGAEPPYEGQPFLLDEWGGFKYLLPEDRENASGWGYNGLDLRDEKAFLDRIGAQARLFARMPQLAGWCYTQLTDVEQEQNGAYTYDRRPKADPAKFARLFGLRPKWSAW